MTARCQEMKTDKNTKIERKKKMHVKETKSVRNKCATGVTMVADR